jgi:hypothetical protein
MDTLGTWFYLKDGRRSFKPDPLRDREVMFCHQEVQENIQKAIERAFATDETVKMLLWGDWGVGKTHALRHLEYWLTNNAGTFPTRTVFAKLGDVAKSSRFGIVQKDLLDGIGIDHAVTLAFKYMQTGRNLVVDLQGLGIPATIAQAFNKLFVATPGQPPPDIVVTAWNFMRGVDVGKSGALVGLQERITDSKDFYFVLASLGHLVRTVEDKQLVFLVDEAARLEAVSDVLEVERHWVNVNTMIFDQENRYFGFVYTVSGKSQDDIPRALFEPQIENRLGNRRLELRNLPPNDVRAFLSRLTDAFVDRVALEADTRVGISKNAAYVRNSYPFTQPGLDRFVDYFHRTPENSKPRDIADRLDEAGFYSLKAGERLISDTILGQVGL